MIEVPSVGVVVFDSNFKKVLLVCHKESAEHLTDTYGLPAGRYDNSKETPKTAAVRELYEETGLKAKEDLIQIPTVYHARIKRKNGFTNFSFIVFICKKYSGNLSSKNETVPEWKEISAINNLDLLPNIEKIISESLTMLDKN